MNFIKSVTFGLSVEKRNLLKMSYGKELNLQNINIAITLEFYKER